MLGVYSERIVRFQYCNTSLTSEKCANLQPLVVFVGIAAIFYEMYWCISVLWRLQVGRCIRSKPYRDFCRGVPQVCAFRWRMLRFSLTQVGARLLDVLFSFYRYCENGNLTRIKYAPCKSGPMHIEFFLQLRWRATSQTGNRARKIARRV